MVSKLRLTQARSRLIAGKALDIFSCHGLLQKIENQGMEDWNGKKVMVNSVRSLTIEELRDQLNKVINKEELNIIGMFMEDEIKEVK